MQVLGSSILAIHEDAHLRAVASELVEYTRTLARDGERFVMNVGADVVEIRNTN